MHVRSTSRFPRRLALAALALTALAPVAAHAAPPAYTLTDLGTVDGGLNDGKRDNSDGRGVNASGQVTGEFITAGDNHPHAFLFGAKGGTLHDLGTPGGGFSAGYGVNDSGQVVGYSITAKAASHAFLSNPNGGTLHDLGTLPGGSFSDGYGVNDSGQVTGTSNNAAGYQRAFLSDPNGGTLHDLGTLPGGSFSTGYGVNASGQVVGASGHAFLFSNGVMTDLNTLIAPNSGFTLSGALSISDNGFITGYGFNSQGQQDAFLLTPNAPVPEASSVVSFGLLLALGFGGIVIARRKSVKA